MDLSKYKEAFNKMDYDGVTVLKVNYVKERCKLVCLNYLISF